MEQYPYNGKDFYSHQANIAHQNAVKSVDPGIEIDWVRLVKAVLKKWWLVVLLSGLLAGLGYYNAKNSYVPVYSSTSSFVINAANPSDYTDNPNSYYNSMSSITQGRQLAGTFKEVLRSNKMLDKVAQSIGAGEKGGYIRGMMSLEVIQDTNILKMTITSTDADMAYNIANAVIKNCQEVIGETIKIGTLEILDNPTRPSGPNSSPQYTKKMTSGFFLGALIAIAIALAFELLRKTVKKSSDIQNVLNVNLLASIPRVYKPGMRKKRLPKGLLITDKTSGFTFMETYRALRTKLETLSEKNHYKTILVSSTSENEGKTTVATNIALTLAQNGKSVLLIDGDLRKPAVHKLLGVSSEENSIGLLQYLKGIADWKDAVRFVESLSIFVMFSGGSTSRSSEHLSSPEMGQLIGELEKEFDYIIIDSSPVSMVTDATVIAGYCDAYVLVVRQDCAKISEISHSLEDLSSRKAELAGCIFNVVESDAITGGYGGYRRKYYKRNYYKSGYGYGYGYGYGSSKDDSK